MDGCTPYKELHSSKTVFFLLRIHPTKSWLLEAAGMVCSLHLEKVQGSLHRLWLLVRKNFCLHWSWFATELPHSRTASPSSSKGGLSFCNSFTENSLTALLDPVRRLLATETQGFHEDQRGWQDGGIKKALNGFHRGKRPRWLP